MSENTKNIRHGSISIRLNAEDDRLMDGLWDRLNKELFKIFSIAEAKMDGRLDQSFPYRIDPQLMDLVVDNLAFIVLKLRDKGKHKKKPPITKVIPQPILSEIITKAHTEICEIFDNANLLRTFESERKKAALKYFDENYSHFEAIKRNYLNNKKIYELNRATHERSDFIGKLLQQLFDDHFMDCNVTIGASSLVNALKKTKRE